MSADVSVELVLREIGEPVTVTYEPRNEEMPWMVSLARVPMIHEHFPTLLQGLEWLADHRGLFAEWEQQIRKEEERMAASKQTVKEVAAAIEQYVPPENITPLLAALVAVKGNASYHATVLALVQEFTG